MRGYLCLFRLVKTPGGGLDNQVNRLFIWLLFKKPWVSLATAPFNMRAKINMAENKGTQLDIKIGQKQSFPRCSHWRKQALLSFKYAILSHAFDHRNLSGFECWHFWGKSWRCHTEDKDAKRVIHTYYIGLGYYWLGCLVKEQLLLTFWNWGVLHFSILYLYCD